MPWSRPRVPERQESVSADGWNDLGCTNSDGKYLVSAGVYDISACDVFDERLDLLYTPGKVYHRHNTLQLWKYWALVVLAIVLVRFLSYNVQSLWDPAEERDVHPQWPALACSLAVVAIVALDGDSLLVTSAGHTRLQAGLALAGRLRGARLQRHRRQPPARRLSLLCRG